MSYELSYVEMVYFNLHYKGMTVTQAEAEARAVLERRTERDAGEEDE